MYCLHKNIRIGAIEGPAQGLGMGKEEKMDIRWLRFLDEVHFGRGPQRKLRIIQKPGERTCKDWWCIRYERQND